MSNRQAQVVIPQAHFTLFDVERSGLPEIICVNAALLKFAEIDIFPWYLCVTIEAEELVENGMPSPAESEQLFAIGDEIQDAVLTGITEHGSVNALFLARSTRNATRELLFQVHNPDITHAALQLLLDSREWKRAWGYEMQSDKAWSNAAHIFQLFPMAHGRDA